MSPETERRLGDLFAAIDDQVEAPPLATATRGRRRWAPILVAACVALVVATAVGLSVRTGGDNAADVAAGPAATMPPAQFDTAAGAVCDALERARNGIDPRFATPEAYLVVAGARRSAVAAAAADLASLPGPADDPALPTRVIAHLKGARAVLDSVELAARAGLVDEAAARWAEVDPTIDVALAHLAEHGAEPCR